MKPSSAVKPETWVVGSFASKENYGWKDQVHMNAQTIRLPAGVSGFAEDKDEAKRLRVQTILPTFAQGKAIVLDFIDIKYSTQSFIHALLGDVLRRHGESALGRIEFKNCAPQVKSLIQLVVDYSLGEFTSQDETPSTKVKKLRPKNPTRTDTA